MADDGTTHFPGCWREHHACAVIEIDNLNAEAIRIWGARMRDAEASAALRDAIRVLLETGAERAERELNEYKVAAAPVSAPAAQRDAPAIHIVQDPIPFCADTDHEWIAVAGIPRSWCVKCGIDHAEWAAPRDAEEGK